MCEDRRDNDCGCISQIIKKIIRLQKNSFKACSQEGCDKPFLGPDDITCFNTRPVSLYNCSTGALWSVDDNTIFRLESLDDCCCTCRILTLDNGVYTSTNRFFTIDINCVSAIKCFNDTYISI